MSKFYILTFGCQMNVNDSSWLSRALVANGHSEVKDEKEADFFILNTCSVREKPEKKVHSAIGRFRKINPSMWGVIMGCVAQQLGQEITKRHINIRLVLGTDTLYKAPEYIEEIIEKEERKLKAKKIKKVDIEFSDVFPDKAHYLEENQYTIENEKSIATGFINIMQGCDNYCAYCIVPYTRGIPKSRSSKSIIEECEKWVDKGAKEIYLLGQNVNAFGLDRLSDGICFSELLKQIDKISGVKRLRFMTPHPKDLAEDTMRLFGELETLCPRVHLPIQAGANRTLKRMNRKYTREDYLGLVHRLQEIRSDITIASDIIVGFPDESEEDFKYTIDIVEEAPIIFAYSFAYSDRPGTKSAIMPNKIPKEVQKERLERLQDVQKKVSEEYLKTLVGRELELLIEGESKQGKSALARDIYGNTVNVATKAQVGSLIQAKITKSFGYSLTADEITK